MMRARVNLPIIPADAMNFARRRQVGERHDGVIPHTAFKNVPEDNYRPAGPGKRQPEAAAFAGIVLRKPVFGIRRAFIARRREEQSGAVIFLATLLRLGGWERPWSSPEIRDLDRAWQAARRRRWESAG
jgi:hypothetical protein